MLYSFFGRFPSLYANTELKQAVREDHSCYGTVNWNRLSVRTTAVMVQWTETGCPWGPQLLWYSEVKQGVRILKWCRTYMMMLVCEQENGVNCIVRSFMICTVHPMWLGWSVQEGWDERGMWHECWRREMCWVLLRNPEGRSPLGRPKYRWEDDVNMSIKEIY